jgi:hypothetical protein
LLVALPAASLTLSTILALSLSCRASAARMARSRLLGIFSQILVRLFAESAFEVARSR